MLDICRDLRRLYPPSGEELVFDLTKYSETNPFSNLVLINSLRRYKKDHPELVLRCKPKEQGGYLSHIGFYQAIGIDYGKMPGEARANPNYVPVTRLSFNHTFYYEIEHLASQLAATIQFDKGLQNFLAYIFVETIRNTYEHAGMEKPNVLVAAQNWPSYNMLEVAIADDGCGVKASLEKHFAKEELGLLKYAIRPGISAKSNYRYTMKNDPWRNSGYGLYMIKESALAYNGNFTICSGGYGLRYFISEDGKPIETVYETDYQGTALGIRFRTNLDKDFSKIRRDIQMNGELLAAQTEGAIRSASKSSGGRYHLTID